jgi:hypothetical protein
MATQKGVLQTFFILLYLFGICVSVQNGEQIMLVPMVLHLNLLHIKCPVRVFNMKLKLLNIKLTTY